MTWREFRKKYNASDNRQAINRAIRAEVPGGSMLLDAAKAMYDEMNQRQRDRSQQRVETIRQAVTGVSMILDHLRGSICQTHGLDEGHGATPPAMPLDAPKTSTRDSTHDNRGWTPAMDQQLGREPDGDLAKRWGISGEAVRRRRLKLGIAATTPRRGWTPERLAVLESEPDNAKAAEALGVSINAVKVRRARLKREGDAVQEAK